MKLYFENLERFEQKFSDYYPFDKCPKCHGNFEIQLSTATIRIEHKKLIVHDCPIQVCQKCHNELIGHRVPMFIYKAYTEFEQHPNTTVCDVTLKGNARFDYAESANFIYDSRDLNIPGCDVDEYPAHTEGFSLPVYFDRKVLNNFYTDDDYELDFFSESYGDIAKCGRDGWEYEWKIPFGINKNDKVIIFLGDLDKIDSEDRAIMWLKSYNIPSDHVLVETELYQAQMNCLFSDPIREERICFLRNGFYKKVNRQYGIDLWHLEEEVAVKRRQVKKPVVYSEREVSANIIALDGILNEGISQDGLKALCKAIGKTDTEIKGLRTRKLLQMIVATKEGDEIAQKVVAPLFHLNDLRVCFAHLLPAQDLAQYKQRIIDAFSLSDFTEYRELYSMLIDELYSLYKYLYMTNFNE